MSIQYSFRSFFLLMLSVLLSSCASKKKCVPCAGHASMPAFFDTRPSTAVSYLYAPGMMNTELGMARYCPDYIASTGEEVHCTSGGNVIAQPHSAVRFAELNMRKPGEFTLNPLTWLIDSIRKDLAPLAQRLMQDTLNFTVKDNPSCNESIINYSFNFSKANLAQKRDIKTFKNAYQEHIKKFPETSVVLYGDSRGAATIFNFIALYNPQQVKAAVLDGMFDSLEHTVKHFLYSDKEKNTEKRLYDIVRFVFGSYNPQGINQRECAEIISGTVPLLFVISLKDGLVAPQSSFYLYGRLRARGHKNVHILVLKKAYHPSYMIDDLVDKKTYEEVVHAFYKHYGLPYNAACAQRGKEAFAQTQPSIEELRQVYPLDQCPACDTTQPQAITKKKIQKTKK